MTPSGATRAAWRRERAPATAAAFVPLSFAPGEAYQFDWSHEVVLIDGVTVTVKVAHVRLCHSRMLFVRAYPRETQEMVFDAHDRAFAFFKGACTRGHLRQHEDGGGRDLRGQGARLQPPLPADVQPLSGRAGRLHAGVGLGEGPGREPGRHGAAALRGEDRALAGKGRIGGDRGLEPALDLGAGRLERGNRRAGASGRWGPANPGEQQDGRQDLRDRGRRPRQRAGVRAAVRRGRLPGGSGRAQAETLEAVAAEVSGSVAVPGDAGDPDVARGGVPDDQRRDRAGGRALVQRRVGAVGELRGDHGRGAGGGLADKRARADGRGAGGGAGHAGARGRGRSLWTGATASLRGGVGTAAFASAKAGQLFAGAVDGAAPRAEGRACRLCDRRRSDRPGPRRAPGWPTSRTSSSLSRRRSPRRCISWRTRGDPPGPSSSTCGRSGSAGRGVGGLAELGATGSTTPRRGVAARPPVGGQKERAVRSLLRPGRRPEADAGGRGGAAGSVGRQAGRGRPGGRGIAAAPRRAAAAGFVDGRSRLGGTASREFGRGPSAFDGSRTTRVRAPRRG